MKRTLMRGGICAGAVIIRLALALYHAWLVSIPLTAAAARERGFEGAYGGEWLLIIAVFVLTYYIAAKVLRLP